MEGAVTCFLTYEGVIRQLLEATYSMSSKPIRF